MEQLFAHLISCYRDELLTHFDYLVCLGQLSVELVQALVLSCQAILPLLLTCCCCCSCCCSCSCSCSCCWPLYSWLKLFLTFLKACLLPRLCCSHLCIHHSQNYSICTFIHYSPPHKKKSHPQYPHQYTTCTTTHILLSNRGWLLHASQQGLLAVVGLSEPQSVWEPY